MTEYTLGIDMGTSGVKVGVLDVNTLQLISLAMKAYDNSAHQPSAMLWEATASAIQEAVAGLDTNEIGAIGLSGQMHGTVLYDSAGVVIEPIINWQDKRCDVPLEKYGNRTTVEMMMTRLGVEERTPADWQRLDRLLQGSVEETLPTAMALEFDDLGIDGLASGYLGATLFYIKENDPTLFNRIAHVVMPTDFVRAQLLGACDNATDPTNACGAGIFNTRLNRWHEGVIRSLDLPLDILPTIHGTSEIAGLVPQAVARSLGLKPGTAVIYGGGDNQLSLLGNGLISGDSPVLINIGTGAQISQVTPTYRRVEGIDTRSYVNGYYVFAGSSLGGGRNYAQLKRDLQHSGQSDLTYRMMDELAAQVAAGADGLQFHIRSRSKRHRQEGFAGNTAMGSTGHRARAVMEGVLMDLYMLCPPTDKKGLMIGSGNGLHGSKVWGQMAADFFGSPIRVTNFENAVWAAALLAAVSTGLLPGLDEAVKSIKASREFEPNPANAAEYQQIKAERLECVYCEKLATRSCIWCGRRFCEPRHSAYRDPNALLGLAPDTIKNAAGYTCYKCWARFVQAFKKSM